MTSNIVHKEVVLKQPHKMLTYPYFMEKSKVKIKYKRLVLRILKIQSRTPFKDVFPLAAYLSSDVDHH